MSYVSYCHGEDQSGIFVLMGKEFNFYGATQGRGWMAVSEKSSGVLDTSLLGGAPIVRAPLGVYPRLCLSPTIRTFHQSTEDYLSP